jgi:hypothetical protein
MTHLDICSTNVLKGFARLIWTFAAQVMAIFTTHLEIFARTIPSDHYQMEVSISCITSLDLHAIYFMIYQSTLP